MDSVKTMVEEKLALLRSKLDDIPALQEVEDKTRVNKEYLVLGAAILLLVFVFFGIGVATLCDTIGYVYPAYQSFLAIESKNKGDDVQWIVYWVLFSFLNIIETFQDFILYWIPFYFAFKLAFLLWAMLPQTRGAKFLYDSFLKDLLKKNGEGPSRIDAAMAESKKSADTTASALADNVGSLTGSSGKKDE